MPARGPSNFGEQRGITPHRPWDANRAICQDGIRCLSMKGRRRFRAALDFSFIHDSSNAISHQLRRDGIRREEPDITPCSRPPEASDLVREPAGNVVMSSLTIYVDERAVDIEYYTSATFTEKHQLALLVPVFRPALQYLSIPYSLYKVLSRPRRTSSPVQYISTWL